LPSRPETMNVKKINVRVLMRLILAYMQEAPHEDPIRKRSSASFA